MTGYKWFLAFFLTFIFISSIAKAQCPNGPCPDRIQRNGGRCIAKSDGSLDCTAAPGKNITLTTTGGGTATVNNATIITNTAGILTGSAPIVVTPGIGILNVSCPTCGIAGSGISTLNTLTGTTQTFATGTGGSDFNISSSGTTHTFNIPDASASSRGLITTGTQTFAGSKNFTGIVQFNAAGTGTATQFLDNSANTSFAFNAFTPDLRIANVRGFVWSSTDQAFGPPDLGVHRNSAGVLEINNGSIGTLRDLTLRNLTVSGTCTGCATSAISTLNTLTGATQTFATGTGGSDFNISSSGTTHTFNIPDASASNRGVVTTGTQTFAGNKTFGNITVTTCSGCVTGVTTLLMAQGMSGVDRIAASTTQFTYPHNYLSTATLWNSSESARGYVMPYDGTLDRLVVKTSNTQSATGTFVVMLRKNAADTTLTLTISAGAAAGFFTDNTHSVSVTAGDVIAIRGANNATANSADFNLLSIRYTTATIP